MSNSYFQFKRFTIHQDSSAMKVTTDGCLFGAWVAKEISGVESKNLNVLDIGTGTGLLSLMITQKNDVNIDALEIDKDAAAQAKENVAASPWKERINVINADVLKWDSDKKYDVIVANPPFYEKEIISQQKKKNIAHHSRKLKFSDLLSVIKQKIHPGGCFFLLLPAKREKEIESLLHKEKLYLQNKIIVKQSVDHDPFRIMVQGALIKTDEISISKMAITVSEKKYTEEFINLLKDYYLHL